MSDSSPLLDCFHCGLPVPKNVELEVNIDGNNRPMCCHGCEAIAKAIIASGLEDFYQFRSELSPTGREVVPDFLLRAKIYDNPDVQKTFVVEEISENNDSRFREASLILEGIVCAACIWLNEQHLRSLPGVVDVSVNYATHRARVKWDENIIHLSDILVAISQIGYIAHPYNPDRAQKILETERRQHLKRLGLAGVLGMQVMVLTVALYSGDWFGIESEYRILFYWLSLILTAPVVLYSGQPFFVGAWRDLKNRRAGMDVPVTLGIGLAFFASAWTTVTGHGQVYFDAVVMFIFFLLTARFFESTARKKSVDALDTVVKHQPAMAVRLVNDQEETVASVNLVAGDRVLVCPGEVIPADGIVVAGQSGIDESLLSGESLPLQKNRGDPVIGGSINCENPLTISVEKTGDKTVLAHLMRLVERAQADRPAMAQLANRVAGWFIVAVLVLATGVGFYWWQTDPAQWLPVTIAVLVVTCPCALSLAAPTAITAAMGKLHRTGLLITRAHALETLAQVTHVLFDKTGTLTEGKLELLDTRVLSDVDAERCQQIAAALEFGSEHPVARAFNRYRIENLVATDINNTQGAGIQGSINGKAYYIGTLDYIVQQVKERPEDSAITELHNGNTCVFLADADCILAVCELGDVLRPGAKDLVTSLKNLGKSVWLVSGDYASSVKAVADACGIEQFYSQQKPEDKLQIVRDLQKKGAVVAMVGDGINDAPVLAAAHVSIAMGSGAQLAAIHADTILISSRLENIAVSLTTAKKTLRIIKQNLVWALGYNAFALPLAAAGWVAPWMAALGMSTSSLIVVVNALRLLR